MSRRKNSGKAPGAKSTPSDGPAPIVHPRPNTTALNAAKVADLQAVLDQPDIRSQQ